MKSARLGIFILFTTSILVGCVGTTGGNSKKTTDDEVTVVFTHEYYWESFSVTPDSPMSPDKRYQLKQVQDNGWVELIYRPIPRDFHISYEVVARSPKDKYEKTSGVLIFVVESDPKAQTATLRELKMR